MDIPTVPRSRRLRMSTVSESDTVTSRPSAVSVMPASPVPRKEGYCTYKQACITVPLFSWCRTQIRNMQKVPTHSSYVCKLEPFIVRLQGLEPWTP